MSKANFRATEYIAYIIDQGNWISFLTDRQMQMPFIFYSKVKFQSKIVQIYMARSYLNLIYKVKQNSHQVVVLVTDTVFVLSVWSWN